MQWWNRRTQKRLVLSVDRCYNVLLMGPELPACWGHPGSPRPGVVLLRPLIVYDCVTPPISQKCFEQTLEYVYTFSLYIMYALIIHTL